MPSVLREHQHELLSLDESIRLVFGTEDTGYQTATRPVVSAGETITQDTARPMEGGRAFGADYRGGKRYTFELNVLSPRGDTHAHRTNNDLLATLEGVWEDERFRSDPDFMAVLRTCEAGRTRRCYGRPRDYAEAVGSLTAQGHTPVVAAFDLIDDRWYDDVDSSTRLTMVPTRSAGLVAPLTTPLASTRRGEASGRFAIAGTRPTWVRARFHGPVTNPVLRIGDLRIGLRTTIPFDEAIIFDSRPWVRSVYRESDGATMAGRIDATLTPPMRDCVFRPGEYPAAYTGLDATATSYVDVIWQNAHSRP